MHLKQPIKYYYSTDIEPCLDTNHLNTDMNDINYKTINSILCQKLNNIANQFWNMW